MTSVTSQIFNAANATINFSPDGYAFSWTSDWLCTLGTNAYTLIGSGPTNTGVTFISGTTYQIASTLHPPLNDLVTIFGATGNTNLNGSWTVTATNAAYFQVSSASNLVCGSNCGQTNLPPVCGGLDWKGGNSTYVAGNIITPSKANSHNYTYVAAGACTSSASASEPTWIPGTVSDNSCTWNYLGIQKQRTDLFVGLTQ
jgi:hypothetical protein